MAWFAPTNPKASALQTRSPEQTRPRLFSRFLALPEAADSPDEAAEAPPAPASSTRLRVCPRRARSGPPNSESIAPSAQTPVPTPQDPDRLAPAQLSDAGTPASTAD